MSKINVVILGATGTVGQRFIQLLDRHPYFEIAAIAASDKSAGKKYKDVVTWKLDTPIPQSIQDMVIQKCEPGMDARIAFSGLDSTVAGEIEMAFAKNGYAVVSNSKNYRMEADVPLIYPEVNADHLALIDIQKKNRGFKNGFIVTNSNCSIMSFLPVIHVLDKNFGVEKMTVVTMQAVSGAGYPGVASLDILGNIVPYIGGEEEEKIRTEPLKILGKLENGRIKYSGIQISPSVNRVPVVDGHLASVSVKLKTKTNEEEIKNYLRNFHGVPQDLKLPLAPERPIIIHDAIDRPQPRLDIHLDKGMAVSVGRIRSCEVLDYKFTCLVHNTIRGAAGAAILNAELLSAKQML
ncbi:aspartate-semialdehyde dehydrogenase [bacterium]|nr:MAG: aspartate-semialdehyde dehydrogenase [bacterium]